MTSLIDPKNPARWADGTPRSQNNGFTRGLTDTPIDWTPFTTALKQRQAQTKRIERARANGDTTGTIARVAKLKDPVATRWNGSRPPQKRAVISIENQATGQASTLKRQKLRRGGL